MIAWVELESGWGQPERLCDILAGKTIWPANQRTNRANTIMIIHFKTFPAGGGEAKLAIRLSTIGGDRTIPVTVQTEAAPPPESLVVWTN